MKSHNSFLSPKCTEKSSPINGKGIFAKKTINKDEVIAIWGGKVYSYNEIIRIGKKWPRIVNYAIEVSPGFFLGPIDQKDLEASEKFNHSCDPNSKVVGQIVLVASKRILPNTEVCFDYESTDSLLLRDAPLVCKCGSKKCRKILRGRHKIQRLSSNLKKQTLNT